MYYKKRGNKLPVIQAGCIYEESYFSDGYLFLRYCEGATPAEVLEEITEDAYEASRPILPEPEPEPSEPTEAEMFQAELLLNQVVMLENQGAQDVVLSELLLGQQGLIGQ